MSAEPLVELRRRLTRPLIAVFIFSCGINILVLAPVFYMLLLFDKVLTSQNLNTLAMLTLILLVCIVVMVVLERTRSSLLDQCGLLTNELLSAPLFDSLHRSILNGPNANSATALRDLEAIRSFFSSETVSYIMDFPWFPIFVFVLWLLHPAFAVLALGVAALLVLITVLNHYAIAKPLIHAETAARRAIDRAASIFANAEVVHAMGMRLGLRRLWSLNQHKAVGWQAHADGVSANFTAVSQALHIIARSGAFALGAYLAIQREIGPGHMVGASILMGIALRPMDGIIARWKAIVQTRDAHRRLKSLFEEYPEITKSVVLPRPLGRVTLQNVAVAPPARGVPKLLLQNITFDLPAGNVLAIVGPSAAGKTSLLRTILGIWPPVLGEVRIDGAELHHWSNSALGKCLGYLPQEVALFAGTVAHNIARFEPDAPSEAIRKASRLARVDEMILMLPEAYETVLGEGGMGLSGGQRQRLGLARAVYGNPSIVILDEPNANLDAEGEAKLSATIRELKEGGSSVIFVTHKTSLLAVADYLLVLGEGEVQHFGEREDVLHKLAKPRVVQLQPQSLRS